MRDFKQLYECLLDTEDLHRMFKGMTGNWEEDKTKFIKYQLELESLANVKEVNEE